MNDKRCREISMSMDAVKQGFWKRHLGKAGK